MNKYLVTFVFDDGRCIDIETQESSPINAHLQALSNYQRACFEQYMETTNVVAVRISMRDAIDTSEWIRQNVSPDKVTYWHFDIQTFAPETSPPWEGYLR